jgi:cytidylate kinase
VFEVRATRRFKELQKRGMRAIYSQILRDIVDRDARDSVRSVAPLEPAKDAFVLDTSNLSADGTFFAALEYISTQNED